MMRRLGYTLLFLGLIGAVDALGQEKPQFEGVGVGVPRLSELQQAKAEAFQLRAQVDALQQSVVSLQAQLALCRQPVKQAQEQSKQQLEAEMLRALGAEKGCTFDWQTLTAKCPPVASKPKP